jgi:hypothetical protein
VLAADGRGLVGIGGVRRHVLFLSQVSVCARRGQVRDEGLSDAGRAPVEIVVCVDDVAIADPPGEAGGHLEALVGVRARPVLRNLATTTSGSVVSCWMY